MEAVRCAEHGSLCFLKTGVRDGPNKGKSFYVCGARRPAACGFVLPATIPASHCLIHEGCVVDLQVLARQQDRDEYQLFYRCLKSKMSGKKWCGSIPWQDPKATEVPKALESQPKIAPVFNPSDQRNPFKVIDKNCEPSSWKQIKQGNREESKEKGVTAEKESVLVSHKEKKPTSTEKEPLEGLRTEKKPSTGSTSHPELKESTVYAPELGPSEACKGRNTLLEEEKHGGSEVFKKTLECVEKEPGGRSKVFQPALGEKSTSAKPLQLGEKGLKSCEGKEIREKECVGGKTGETKQISPAVPHSVLQHAAPKGQAEAVPAETQNSPDLGACALEVSGSDTDGVRCGYSSGDKSEPEKPVGGLQLSEIPAGKSGKTIQGTPLPEAAASHHVEGHQDPKALHTHLVSQLKQKKSTLARVNIQLLPDGGERLLKQVQDLEARLSALNILTADVTEKGENSTGSSCCEVCLPNPFGRPGGTKLTPPLPLQDPTAGASSGSHNRPSAATTLGSSEYYGHDFGMTFGVQNLYGGRMTADRIRAVHNATSEAINHLYKSLESCPTQQMAAEDPPGLKVPLLLHQKQALAWLLWRESQRPCGGILADDMGLGKTLTMIALILAQKQMKTEEKKKLEVWLSKNESIVIPSCGTLIICPASLIHHWKKEIERRVGYGRLRVYLYHGPNRDKHAEVLAAYDVVVTTYSLLSKEVPTSKEEGEVPAEDHELGSGSSPSSPLLRVAWARVILDEAHNIKNPRVQTSIAVCKLRAGARWAVTGTPIQNNLLDMYSLLRFLRCSPFDEYKVWKSQVDNNTRKGGERLSLLTKSLLLRRTKDQLDSTGKPLVSLPQRSSQLHQLKLSAEEQSVYDVLFARSRSTLQSYLKRQEQKNGGTEYAACNPFEKVAQEFGVSQKEFLAGSQSASQVSSTVHVLSMLLRLRQCCCHLSLLKVALDQANLNSEGLSLSIEEQLSALTLSELQTPDSTSTVRLNGVAFKTDTFEITKESTKIAHLLAELKAIQSQSQPQKSVVVSQWTSMLKVVGVHLQRLGLKYATVDGSVNPKQRMDVVEEFNNNPRGPQVMLVSLLAGGVGLNLTGGNHLFLLDMHWNPALEDQACDRIYRVGQQKDVVIHRFVCEGTVEEKIVQLQKRKKVLAQQVLSGKGETFTKLTLADLKILFGI
ncbi:TTF2 factor, partial [Zapornia atra]|nr:TTF2 factor [Zapornia atra]